MESYHNKPKFSSAIFTNTKKTEENKYITIDGASK